MTRPFLSGQERFFNPEEIIVSKTDLKGRIEYANQVFLKISLYKEKELLGAPHSILRHPDMPRCIFKLLWERIAAGGEIFAYVLNRAKNGDHYWVLAHVTPSFGADRTLTGYHSNRRVPDRHVIDNIIRPLYARLLEIENKAANHKDGMNAAYEYLVQVLKEKGVSYDEFVFSHQR